MIIKIIIAFLIIFFIFVFFESYRECKKFKITKYEIIDKNAKEFSGLKIAMLADMHTCLYNNDEIFEAIRMYMPDMIIIAGDMVVCREHKRENNLKTAEFINQLASVAPVYYGMGNHEMGLSRGYNKTEGFWKEYVASLNSKVFLLTNGVCDFETNKGCIKIYGLDLDGEYYTRIKEKQLKLDDINNLVGNKGKDYSILIAHNPDYFETYCKWGANLIASGHNHGGLMRLPFMGGVISPRLHIFPKYDYGIYRNGQSTMILTNGLGAHSMKIRVNNIPEIVFIEIKNM